MIAEIETAALARLAEAGLQFGRAEVGDDPKKWAKYPVAMVRVEKGEVYRQTMNKLRLKVRLVVWLGFKDWKSDAARREGLWPIVEGVFGWLAGSDLDLAIDNLVPLGFANVTDDEVAAIGIIAYQAEFTTAFNLAELPAEEQAADLIRIGLSYYLQEPEDDGTADASDTVSLEQD